MKLTVKTFSELSASEVYEILKARAEIFVAEQGIRCCDPDGLDRECLHCYLSEGDEILAYLRAHKTDRGAVKIGRVLSITHGKGHGKALMNMSMDKIRRHFGIEKIVINAQKRAVGFYEKMGFVTVGEEFLEEGVAHIGMEFR